MKQVIVFDIRTRKMTSLDIKPIVEQEIENVLNAKFSDMGIEIDIKEIKDVEKFVEKYYTHKGYNVIRCQPHTSCRIPNFIFNYLEENYKIYVNFQLGDMSNNWRKYCIYSGVPDFLIYRLNDKKEITELFFVEAKSQSDSVRMNQLFWACSSNVPLKVLHLTQDTTWTYLFKQE